VKELQKRLRGVLPTRYKHIKKRMTLSFNPISRSHWIYKEYFEGKFKDSDTCYRDDNLQILKTTYKNNRFLTSEDRRDLESEKDEYYYKVYTLGEWGVLGNLVFKNWQIADLSGKEGMFDVFRNGLDFGFTNDPTAALRTARHKKDLYLLGGLYDWGLTNDVIATRLKPIIGNENIYCDSAEPKSIRELQQYGISAYSALKGAGSLNYGIQWINQHNVFIDRRLQGVINDYSLYQYRKNKDGETLNEPIDRNNHAPDATRYAWSDVLTQELDGIKGISKKRSAVNVF